MIKEYTLSLFSIVMFIYTSFIFVHTDLILSLAKLLHHVYYDVCTLYSQWLYNCLQLHIQTDINLKHQF